MNPLPVREPLDLLQLEFPQYRISMQTIWDKLFYIAEAHQPEVQPRFAQAETAERLRAKLQVPLRPFTTAEPSIARVWDFLLGGKDNFATRPVTRRPNCYRSIREPPSSARESRQFPGPRPDLRGLPGYPAVR